MLSVNYSKFLFFLPLILHGLVCSMFQVGGDFEDLESVLGKPDIQRPLGSGSCSALVKVLPDNSDLYVAQDTWNNYQGMLRILKVYNFSFSLVDGTSGE